MRRHRGFRLGLLAVMMSLPLGPALAGDTPARPITVGIAIPSYVHAVAWIARDKGFFAREGLEADVQVMGGSSSTVRTLIAGQVDFGLAGGDAVVKANLAGADLVVIAGLVDRFYHRLIVRAEIGEPADLRGKTIGLPFLGGPQDMAVRYALRSMGLSYNGDVKVLSLGKEFNRLVALSRGDIQGTTSQTPISRLRELGFRVLADLPSWDVRFPYLVAAVRRSFLTEHRDTARSFLKALCEATSFYRDEAHKDESLSIIGRYIHHADSEGAAEERYATGGPGLISYPPYPTVEGFETVVQFLEEPKARRVRLDQLIDARLLDELRSDGACADDSTLRSLRPMRTAEEPVR